MKYAVPAICFLLVTCKIVVAQNPNQLTVEGKRFNTYEASGLMKKSRATEFVFRNCDIEITNGQFTFTSFDDPTLAVPSHIKSLVFEYCRLKDVDVVVDTVATSLQFHANNTDLLRIEAGNDVTVYSTNVRELSFIPGLDKTGKTIDLYNETIDKITISNAPISQCKIESCNVGQMRITNGNFNHLNTGKESKFYTTVNKFSVTGEFEYFGTPAFDTVTLEPTQYSAWSNNNSAYVNYFYNGLELINNDFESLTIIGCQFILSQKSVLQLYHNRINDLNIIDTKLPVFDCFNTNVARNFMFERSSLMGLNLLQCEFPSLNVSGLSFDKLAGGKLYLFDPTNVQHFSMSVPGKNESDSLYIISGRFENRIDTVRVKHILPYRALSKEQLADDYLFSDLITTYSKLYQIYRQRGDLESANLAYAEMKDLTTEKLKVRYHQAPGFKSFFRWQLAEIVKLYTNHGTDPALAMTISFWIICLFGVFFFFFPSDWDVSSKSKLLQNYRTFIEKNDKGYFKPFLTLSAGFLLSFFNALTLSLNAYTTLGFGNIPTHGLARYACVLEGFIGWFMLSIFTVALINQVLT